MELVKDFDSIGHVCIVGPMSGKAEFNRPLFNKIEHSLQTMGYQVFNPARTMLPKGFDTWEAYMRISLRQVLNTSALFLVEGWEESRGAKLEMHLALHLGIPVMPPLSQIPVKQEVVQVMAEGPAGVWHNDRIGQVFRFIRTQAYGYDSRLAHKVMDHDGYSNFVPVDLSRLIKPGEVIG